MVLDFDNEAATKAAKIFYELEKNGNIIDIKDILISAIVLVNDFSFKTNNKKDFKRIKGLRLYNIENNLEKQKNKKEASN